MHDFSCRNRIHSRQTGWGLQSAFGMLCTTLRPMHVPTPCSSCCFHVVGYASRWHNQRCCPSYTHPAQVVFFGLLLPLVFFLCFEVSSPMESLSVAYTIPNHGILPNTLHRVSSRASTHLHLTNTCFWHEKHTALLHPISGRCCAVSHVCRHMCCIVVLHRLQTRTFKDFLKFSVLPCILSHLVHVLL